MLFAYTAESKATGTKFGFDFKPSFLFIRAELWYFKQQI